MKNQIKEMAHDLFAQNYSAKEAAIELVGQASQSTLYRWYEEFETEQDFLHGIADDPPQQENDGDLEKEEYFGELEEDNLGELEEDEAQEIELDEGETQNTELEIDNEEVDEEADEIQIRKMKRGVEKKAKKLFHAIKSHSSSHEWSHSQINRMLLSLGNTQEEVEKLLKYDPTLYRENAFWVNLEEFIDLFQSFASAGGSVELNFSEDQQDEINVILRIQEFNEEYDWKNEFDAHWDRLQDDLVEINNQRIDADIALTYQNRIDGLIKDLKYYDAESEELKPLNILSRDFKKLLAKIEDSFWGSVEFVLDEDLQLS